MEREARKAGATETFLRFAGAATGTLLVLYFFGGLVLWVRFHAAGIPADQTLSVLPRELLVVVGLRTLVVEIVVFGVVASAASALAWRWNARSDVRRLPPATGVVGSAIFVGALLVAAVAYVTVSHSHPRLTTGGAAWVAGVAVAAVVVVSLLYGMWLNRRLDWGRKPCSPWPLQRVILLSMPMVAITAATIGLAFEGAKAPIFPAVKIVRNGKAGPIDGFFVGETSSEILVEGGLCEAADRTHERLFLVPRADVADIAMTSSVRLTDKNRLDEAREKLGVCGAKPE